jgi:hypothetical protein
MKHPVYRKILNDSATELLQKDLDSVRDLAVQKSMKINPGKIKP